MGAIAQQFSALGETYQRFLNIRARSDQERKRELVENRRRLAEQLGRLEELVIRNDESSVAPPLAMEFRKRLSKLRSTVSYHQASWPAVKIDEDPDGYRRTSREAELMFHEFLVWGSRQFPN